MEGQGVYSPKEQYKQMFIEAVGKRPGSMVLWRVLDEIGFFNSPASANHHLNVPGGLLIHSLNVAKAAMELCETERFAQCDKERCADCRPAARCLQGWEVHCKAGGRVSVQRHPDAGAW